MAIQRTLYLVGLVAWITSVILYPTWIGRYLSQDMSRPGDFHEAGVFGLRGADGFKIKSPIWDPPEPESGAIPGQVRWPWQRARQDAHVELAMGEQAFRFTLGVLVLGMVLRAGTWLTARGQPDAVVTVAWSLSLALALFLAWLCLWDVSALTFRYGATDGVIIAMLGLGVVGGCVSGGFSVRSDRSRFSAAPAAQRPFGGAAAARPEAGTGRAMPAQAQTFASGLFWFVIGVICALGLTTVAGWMGARFRGPIIGVWELGTPRYAQDQTPINVATGLGMLSAGWVLGLLLHRRRSVRGLAVGLVVGSTLLGMLFALQ